MNKVVLITGASSGIGQKLKEYYTKQNDIVLNISRNVENDDYNFSCDISNIENLEKVFNQITDKYNHIDILINCAGYGISGASELISDEEVKRIFDVNFFGTYKLIKLCLPLMNESSKIINISSACALFPLPFRTLYCASKSAVTMFSECLRMELFPTKIQVTNICPGDIKTNFTKNRVKVFATNERYGNRIENATKKVDSREHRRMSIDYACKKIFKICEKKKLKSRYIIGAKYKTFYILQKMFPKSWFDKVVYKMFGGNKWQKKKDTIYMIEH